MTEEIFGAVNVMKSGLFGVQHETLFFTQKRIIVAKRGGGLEGLGGLGGAIGGAVAAGVSAYKAGKREKELVQLSAESILTADKKNFVIDNSEVVKVELKKYGRGAKKNIETREKEHKWYAEGIPGQKENWRGMKFEEYVPVLEQLVLSDKLVISR